MYCNILHRAASTASLDSLKFQQDEAHKLGFKTTLHMSLRGMDFPEVIEYYKEQASLYGDEIGIHFHNIESDAYREAFGNDEQIVMLYLKPLEERKKIIDFVFERFYGFFGFYPVSIAGYYFDADSLAYINEKYPSVKIAITSCFEEGIKMFAGCSYTWYLFSEGGPWTAYYPSKSNSLCPAKDKEEAIDIICVPHLNRDMLMSYLSRDDYFSAHTANMQRGKLNRGKKCQYIYDFLDEWLEQDKYNDTVYFNNYTGSGWLNEGKNFEETSEVSKDLYRQCLQYYKKKSDEGKLQVMTMEDYAKVHKDRVKVGRGDVNLFHDLASNSGRELLWYVDSNWRVAIDPICGGSVVDLRPYAGRVKQDLGPNSSQLWNGSYPFALNFLHRQAYISSVVGSAPLINLRCHVNKIERLDEHQVCVEFEPMVVGKGENEIEFVSKFLFCDDGRLYLKKKILRTATPDAKVKVIENMNGTLGRTEYPEDMAGITMYAENKNGENAAYSCEYNNRSASLENATLLNAKVPMLNTEFSFESDLDGTVGEIREGAMTKPYYTMCMTQYVKAGEESSVCLRIKNLK